MAKPPPGRQTSLDGFHLDTCRIRLLDFPPEGHPAGKEQISLKRFILITGIGCLLLAAIFGFLVGLQVEHARQAKAAVETRFPERPAPGAQLPEGHPPVPSAEEVEILKKAVSATPTNTTLMTELANKLYDCGRFSEAVVCYQRVMEQEPRNIAVMTDLGTALFYSGRADEAIAQYNRSLEIDPRHVEALHNLVIVYLQGKKDSRAASAAMDQLVAVDPQYPAIPQLQKMLALPAAKGTPNQRQRIF
jgi:tetratricopeptide (TPR) repeat protein